MKKKFTAAAMLVCALLLGGCGEEEVQEGVSITGFNVYTDNGGDSESTGNTASGKTNVHETLSDNTVTEQEPDTPSTAGVSIYFTNISGIDIDTLWLSTVKGDVNDYEILGEATLTDGGFFLYSGSILDDRVADDAVRICVEAGDKSGNVYDFGKCTLYDITKSTVVLNRDRKDGSFTMHLDRAGGIVEKDE